MVPGRLLFWGGAAALLTIPLLARWPWTASDFLFAAVMFGTVGGIFELAMRMTPNPAYRAAVAVALGASFLLVWINGAVGIIGDEDNAANLMYLGVIGVALAGAAIALFKAAGMARAMFAAAGAQGVVTAIVLLAGLGANEPPGALGVLGLNLFFLLPWLVSGALFRRAARDAQL
ncbi:MAG: hypothetical protein J7500_17760 [Sphingomonas sp.]|uniref:hypothetical protein n=1 Tax=Sphingomonas sp. TaxID=28214 RepID=UPI001B13D92D|nr:hypothetical protein [Sphingomonas sp.]MBO9624558.1 hypothetical protein [Sphingomonas sp.]